MSLAGSRLACSLFFPPRLLHIVDDVPECDVVVFFRGQAMTLRCRNYDQAVEWARIECKTYKVADGFTVEDHPGKRGPSVPPALFLSGLKPARRYDGSLARPR